MTTAHIAAPPRETYARTRSRFAWFHIPYAWVATIGAAVLFGMIGAAEVHAQSVLPLGFTDSIVVGGLDFPTGMARLPDGRVFVIEQKTAKVRLIVNGAMSSIDPVCTIDQVNGAGNEQGLLGIAVDSKWPAFPYIYIHCDATVPASKIRISRYTVTGDLTWSGNGALSIDVASRRDLITQLPDAAINHNGGTLRFGPGDMLYDSIGEDAQPCLAQDDSTLHGCILRLDVRRLPATPGGPPTLDVITPPDNPQVGSANLLTRLIWAWGLRNPFRFQIDPTDGVLYIGDVGQDRFEEIDRAAVGGLDFGWPIFEGPALYQPSCDSLGHPLTKPIAWYDRTAFSSGSAAVMCAGPYHAAVSAPQAFPAEYNGDVLYSDYYEGIMRRVHFDGTNWLPAAPVAGQPSSTDWAEGMDGVSDYSVAPDGSLWYCRQHVNYLGNSGEIHRIFPTPATLGLGGPGERGAATFALATPYPQPAKGSVRFRFTLGAKQAATLTIYDVRGRRVRDLAALTGASAQATWDGNDERGLPVPPGLYFARLQSGALHSSQHVMLLR
jgi:glucose/arabinose dehydrogenase